MHARTGEGLVRGCACGDREGVSSPELGVAHVSCLWIYAEALYFDTDATLDGLGEAVTTLEELERITRRTLGAHPITLEIGRELRNSRAVLRARESRCPSSGPLVFAFAIFFLAWICWKFGLGAMVFTFAVIVFVPRVINE